MGGSVGSVSDKVWEEIAKEVAKNGDGTVTNLH